MSTHNEAGNTPYIVNIPDGMEVEEWAELMGQHLRMFRHAPTDAQNYNTHVYLATLKKEGILKGAIIGLHNLSKEGQDHMKSFASKYAPGSCIICAKELGRYPNDAEPLISGQCCDACNQVHVVPHRMLMMIQKRREEEFSSGMVYGSTGGAGHMHGGPGL